MKKPPKLLQMLALLTIPTLLGATQLTDPTRPPDYVATTNISIQPLTLTAIFTYPDYKVAIINGQAIKEGGHIDQFTITSITPYTVELIGPQNTKELLTLTVPVIQRKN